MSANIAHLPRSKPACPRNHPTRAVASRGLAFHYACCLIPSSTLVQAVFGSAQDAHDSALQRPEARGSRKREAAQDPEDRRRLIDSNTVDAVARDDAIASATAAAAARHPAALAADAVRVAAVAQLAAAAAAAAAALAAAMATCTTSAANHPTRLRFADTAAAATSAASRASRLRFIDAAAASLAKARWSPRSGCWPCCQCELVRLLCAGLARELSCEALLRRWR